jgi:hypothetical protein
MVIHKPMPCHPCWSIIRLPIAETPLEVMPVRMRTAYVWVILPAPYHVLVVSPCIALSQTVPASSMMLGLLGHTRSCLQGTRCGSRHIPTPTPTDRPATNGLLAVICGAYTTPMQPLPPRRHCWDSCYHHCYQYCHSLHAGQAGHNHNQPVLHTTCTDRSHTGVSTYGPCTPVQHVWPLLRGLPSRHGTHLTAPVPTPTPEHLPHPAAHTYNHTLHNRQPK